MRVSLPYGTRALEVELPEDTVVLVPPVVAALSDPRAAVQEALESPLGTAALRAVAAGRQSACIVISDSTRPAVGPWVVPELCDVLADAGVGAIEILIATGTHRAATQTEVVALVGEEIPRRYRVRSHDAADGEHVHVGHTSPGVPVWIDGGYARSELRIVVGVVEPHLMAGYSGGAKSVCPGLAGLDTVRGVHRASVARDRVGPGVVRGNPFRSEIREAAGLAGVDFSVQVCATPEGTPAHVSAGALDATVSRSVAFAASHSRVSVEAPHGVVVSTAGGAPLDRTLYQAAKGWSAAQGVVHPGGDLVLVAELSNGLGSAEFEKLLAEVHQPAEMDRLLDSPEFARRDQWMAQHIFQARRRATLHIVSSLPPDRLEALGFRAYRSADEALSNVLPRAGDAGVLVLPRGPFCVAGVGEQLTTLEGALV